MSATACKNAETSKLRDVAARANPVILELRKPVATVLSKNAGTAQVLSACREALDIAGRLRGLDFADRDMGSSAMSIEDVLYGFTFEPETQCKPDTGDGAHNSRCVSWCQKRFGQLTTAIERAREKADSAGVKIEALQ
jgi:hypothetical protein